MTEKKLLTAHELADLAWLYKSSSDRESITIKKLLGHIAAQGELLSEAHKVAALRAIDRNKAEECIRELENRQENGYQYAITQFRSAAETLKRHAEQMTLEELAHFKPIPIDEARRIAAEVLLKLADSMASHAPVWEQPEQAKGG